MKSFRTQVHRTQAAAVTASNRGFSAVLSVHFWCRKRQPFQRFCVCCSVKPATDWTAGCSCWALHCSAPTLESALLQIIHDSLASVPHTWQTCVSNNCLWLVKAGFACILQWLKKLSRCSTSLYSGLGIFTGYNLDTTGQLMWIMLCAEIKASMLGYTANWNLLMRTAVEPTVPQTTQSTTHRHLFLVPQVPCPPFQLKSWQSTWDKKQYKWKKICAY